MCCGKLRIQSPNEHWWENVYVEHATVNFHSEQAAREFLKQDGPSLPARQWLLYTALDFRRKQVEK